MKKDFLSKIPIVTSNGLEENEVVLISNFRQKTPFRTNKEEGEKEDNGLCKIDVEQNLKGGFEVTFISKFIGFSFLDAIKVKFGK